jgi:CHASE1-domain containing sensor protein
MAGEEGTRREEQPAGQARGQADQAADRAGQATGSTSAWSYFLVRLAILSVTVAFIFVMGLFAFIGVFNSENAANITAALGSLFGVVGTLVGAYFGIKASSDAQDSSATTAQRAVQDQKETAQRSVETQKNASMEAGEKILAAAQTPTQSNPTTASQKAPGSNPMSWALAMLIPAAGGASLLVLRYYLRQRQDAA